MESNRHAVGRVGAGVWLEGKLGNVKVGNPWLRKSALLVLPPKFQKEKKKKWCLRIHHKSRNFLSVNYSKNNFLNQEAQGFSLTFCQLPGAHPTHTHLHMHTHTLVPFFLNMLLCTS